MREGMYLLNFIGPAGNGTGTFTLESGRLYGFDVGGGVYDGSYSYDPVSGMVKLDMEVRMPAGVPSVLGPAQPFDWTLKVSTSFDREHSGQIEAHTDLGAVTANIQFMRGLPIAA